MAASNFEFTLEASQEHGNLILTYSTTAPFWVGYGQIVVYTGDFPTSNPNGEFEAWTWCSGAGSSPSPWDTGVAWGSGWNCAWIGRDPTTTDPQGQGVYIVKLTTP